MNVRHPGFRSYYVRIKYHHEHGFTFHPHYLDIPADIIATITWFTDDPSLEFTGFVWCNENEHCSHRPIIRGRYMVGAATAVARTDDVYWKYQVKAKLTEDGRTRNIESRPCPMTADGLPAIHPKHF